MLEIVSFTLGPAQTNAYLIADPETTEAAVIDPSWDGRIILKAAQDRGWRIGHLLYTHAHFDHIGRAAAISRPAGAGLRARPRGLGEPAGGLEPVRHERGSAQGGCGPDRRNCSRDQPCRRSCGERGGQRGGERDGRA